MFKNFNLKKILVDIILLFLQSQQKIVFRLEKKPNFEGGLNTPLPNNCFSANYVNPVPDHTTYSKSFLDYIKILGFSVLVWITLPLTILAAIVTPDLLSVGYLIGSFIFLWKGNSFYLWKPRRIRLWWKIFLVYAIFSVFIKISFSVAECFVQVPYLHFLISYDSFCPGVHKLYWDCACFVSFLFQIRYLGSNYFLYDKEDVSDLQALSSYGASVIEKLNLEKLRKEREWELRTLEKIKEKVYHIKAMQRKKHDRHYKEPVTHAAAVRMGDYLMYEGNDLDFRRRLQNHQDHQGGLIKPLKTDHEAAPINYPKPKAYSRFGYFMHFIYKSIEDIMATFIVFFNKHSKDYRYIHAAMKCERIRLQKKTETKFQNPSDIIENFEKLDKRGMKLFTQFLLSLTFFIRSKFEVICYLSIIIHHTICPSILSLPLPLMVFLWGSLTPIRPTAAFWITMTAYIEIMILLKTLMKNKTFEWLRRKGPYLQSNHPPFVIGLADGDVCIGFDIFVLIVVFIQRINIKSQGLWQYGEIILEKQKSTEFLQKSLSGTFSKFEFPLVHIVQYFSSIINFFKSIRNKSRVPIDIYKYLFFLEFLNIFVVFFGFYAFTPHVVGSEVAKLYVVENNVPGPYFILLIIQFALCLVNRALYKRKHVFGKILFLIVEVIATHIWLFLILPYITNRPFQKMPLPQAWYVIKCIYFLLSAYQIRIGYPLHVEEHFLTKKFGYFNWYSFKVLQYIPFFNQFRAVLDWCVTKTSLTLNEWFRVESIFEVVYECKCSRWVDKHYPYPRGISYPKSGKILNGTLCLAFLIILMWGPLLLFTIFNTLAESSIPNGAIFTLRINSFTEIYSYRFYEDDIKPFTPEQFRILSSYFHSNVYSISFLNQYDPKDITSFQLPESSESKWAISEKEKIRLLTEMTEKKSASIYFSWMFFRKEDSDKPFKMERVVTLNANDTELLVNIISNASGKIVIKRIVPNFIMLSRSGGGKVIDLDQMVFDVAGKHSNIESFRNISIELYDTGSWDLTEPCVELKRKLTLRGLPFETCKLAIIYTFCEKTFPSIFNFITARGIIGIYLSAIFVFWNVFRRTMSNMYVFILYTEMTDIDPIFQLCKDIYMARENEDFALEEDLYAQLLFLYRSPETMIKWTREREVGDDDDL